MKAHGHWKWSVYREWFKAVSWRCRSSPGILSRRFYYFVSHRTGPCSAWMNYHGSVSQSNKNVDLAFIRQHWRAWRFQLLCSLPSGPHVFCNFKMTLSTWCRMTLVLMLRFEHSMIVCQHKSKNSLPWSSSPQSMSLNRIGTKRSNAVLTVHCCNVKSHFKGLSL